MYTIAMTADGDLDFSNRHGRVITGRDKLSQQLIIWLRENIRIDRFHPEYGSQLSSMIGMPHTQEALDGAIAEVRRVVLAYMSMIAELFDRNPSSYSKDEVPAQFLYIDGVFEGMYSIRVKFTIRTLANEEMTAEYVI